MILILCKRIGSEAENCWSHHKVPAPGMKLTTIAEKLKKIEAGGTYRALCLEENVPKWYEFEIAKVEEWRVFWKDEK